MRRLRLVIATVVLALSPLAWTSTITPSAQPIRAHDQCGKAVTLAGVILSVPTAQDL